MNQKQAVLGLKVLLWIGALTPAAWMVGGIVRGWLGANPIERLTHVSGLTALVLLLISLSITPLRRLTGWNPIIRLRRPIGLFAFFYALAHFSVWFVFDMNFEISSMVADVVERKYITVGMTALVILLPIAATSTKGWIRRLGKRWATLHRGVYVAAALGVVHFYWLVKADLQLPLLLATCLTILLVARIPRVADVLSRKRPTSRSSATVSGSARTG